MNKKTVADLDKDEVIEERQMEIALTELENKEEDKGVNEQLEEQCEQLKPQHKRHDLISEDLASMWSVKEQESEANVSDGDSESGTDVSDKELCDVVKKLQEELLHPSTEGKYTVKMSLVLFVVTVLYVCMLHFYTLNLHLTGFNSLKLLDDSPLHQWFKFQTVLLVSEVSR